MAGLLNDLVLDNPMNLEAVRIIRRFLRTGGDSGRALNYTVLGLLAVVYIWIHVVIVRMNEDLSFLLLVIEALILTIVVPMSVYASVSGERERLTWDSLQMTHLTPLQIVVGKLLWRIGLIVAIMALFVPPLIACHLCGHHGMGDMNYSVHSLLAVYGNLFAWSILLLAIGLFFSVRTKRSVTTLSIISVVVLFFLVLVPMLCVVFGPEYKLQYTPLGVLGDILCKANPFYVLAFYAADPSRMQNTPDWYGAEPLVAVQMAMAAVLTLTTLGTLRGQATPRRTL